MYYILNTDLNTWNLYLEKLSHSLKDIYYTSDYYKMYEKNEDGIGKLFVYEEKKSILLYPFMLNEIKGYDLSEKYYDIQTAYGYGGPITNCNDLNFISRFENQFIEYCKNNNIIAEFIRFHPLLNNYNIFKTNIDILHNRVTVFINLNKTLEQIWNEDISSKNRNMIRKAEKNNLTVEESDDYDVFQKIYVQTMNKVNAEDFYYFNDEYYKQISNDKNYILLNVKREDIFIASAIFIKYGDFFHYHLSGSLKEYLKFAPNNLLLWEAVKMAHKKGCRYFHLGGGLTNSVEDNLFKFKSSFSKNYADFYIGKRIHDKKIYNYLIKQWEQKNNKKARLLLEYRNKS